MELANESLDNNQNSRPDDVQAEEYRPQHDAVLMSYISVISAAYFAPGDGE